MGIRRRTYLTLLSMGEVLYCGKIDLGSSTGSISKTVNLSRIVTPSTEALIIFATYFTGSSANQCADASNSNSLIIFDEHGTTSQQYIIGSDATTVQIRHNISYGTISFNTRSLGNDRLSVVVLAIPRTDV